MNIHDIIADLEGMVASLKGAFTPARKAIENDLKDLESKSIDYIKTNGLQDLYQLAATLLPALTGSPWGSVLAALEAKALELGKALVKGEAAIVAAQAQADLIAVGKLIAPVANTVAASQIPTLEEESVA
jgi:hypothetical protein